MPTMTAEEALKKIRIEFAQVGSCFCDCGCPERREPDAPTDAFRHFDDEDGDPCGEDQCDACRIHDILTQAGA